MRRSVLEREREHVEREHLRPHVAVVARGVVARDVAEGRGEHRALDVAERRRGLEVLPHGERRARIGVKLYVERGIEPLACVADALPVAARGIEPLDVVTREMRAIRADRLEELEWLLAPRPFLEHLRRR